jgi:hypothetical protein
MMSIKSCGIVLFFSTWKRDESASGIRIYSAWAPSVPGQPREIDLSHREVNPIEQ